MSEVFAQIAPLLSVNEPEAQVIGLFAVYGAEIAAGDPLCTLETTKATFEVQAEVGGYIQEVLVTKGQQVSAGAILFLISQERPPEKPVPQDSGTGSGAEEKPEGLLITEKGLRLARKSGVSLKSLPIGSFVTEAIVREFAAKTPPAQQAELFAVPEIKCPFDARKLLIFGAGGHARTIIDLVRQSNQYHLVGMIAEPPHESEVLGVPVLGGEDILKSIYDSGIRLMVIGVGAINRNQTRHEVFARMAEKGFAFPAVVHPKAVVEPSADIAAGVQVFGMAFVGSAAQIGFGAIVNTGAIVSHDCRIGDLAHLTPGVVLAGSVEVGTGALIGMGVTTAIGVKIGAWARIGNGARVNGDVPAHAIVQAGASWP